MEILRKRWSIVAAGAFALIVGGTPMLVVTFGVLLKPITESMGWSRADASLALSLMLFATAFLSPVVGVVVDRFGVQRLLIGSILVTACVLALISTIQSLFTFWLVFLLLGMVSPGLQPVLYSKVVVDWFDDRRGLALGVLNAGQGVGSALMGPITGLLLAAYGWRGAYLGLAVLLLIITLPGAIFVIRQNPAMHRDRVRAANAHSGRLPWRDLLASRPFWLVISSAFVLSMAINGALPHMVPLLTDRGYSLGAAVGTMSVLGLAGIGGRLGTGWLVDRFFAPYVALVVFALAAGGMAIIWLSPVSIPVVAGIILIGAGIGAEIDLMSYLTSRYFPRQAFGSVYGLVFFALIMGQALGAYVMGQTFQSVHSYAPALCVFTFAVLLTGLVALLFGPYPFPPHGAVSKDGLMEPAWCRQPCLPALRNLRAHDGA